MINLESPRRMAIHGHARHVPVGPRDVYMSVMSAIMEQRGVLCFRVMRVSKELEQVGACCRIEIDGLVSSKLS